MNKVTIEALARALVWDACKDWEQLTDFERAIVRSRAEDMVEFMDSLEVE